MPKQDEVAVAAEKLQPGQYVRRLRAFVEHDDWQQNMNAANFDGYVERVEVHPARPGPSTAVTFRHGRTVWAMPYAPADVWTG
jgi:hypothetical protein